MCNVPQKFYQVCRLCLTVVSDSDVVNLSIFDAPQSSSIKAHHKNVQQQIINKINAKSVITLNHRKSDENFYNAVPIVMKKEYPTIAAAAAVDADKSNAALPDTNDNDDINGGDDDGDDDDSLLDIHERIHTFLAITVSKIK